MSTVLYSWQVTTLRVPVSGIEKKKKLQENLCLFYHISALAGGTVRMLYLFVIVGLVLT